VFWLTLFGVGRDAIKKLTLRKKYLVNECFGWSREGC
jgi:hypothetical protein